MARKKVYEIVNNSRHGRPLEIGGRKLPFGRQGAFHTTDKRLADDIDAVYGKRGSQDAVVIECQTTTEPGHNYVFGGQPEMPWKKKRGKKQPSKYRWVEVAPGKWKMVKKEE